MRFCEQTTRQRGLYPMECVWKKEASCLPCERIINGCVQTLAALSQKYSQHSSVEQQWISCWSQKQRADFQQAWQRNDSNEVRDLKFGLMLARFRVVWPKYAPIRCRDSYVKHCFIWTRQGSNRIKRADIFCSSSSRSFHRKHWSSTSALRYRRLNHICENANAGVHLSDRFLPLGESLHVIFHTILSQSRLLCLCSYGRLWIEPHI